jgi:uncharacterized protein YycO
MIYITLIASLFGALFWFWSSNLYSAEVEDRFEERTRFFLAQLKPEQLQDGNLIFVRKPGVWGDISQAFSEKDPRYTHVGMLSYNKGRPTVIHADGDPMDPRGQVREEPLEVFVQLANAVGIYGFKFNQQQKQQFVLKAREYVKKGYKFNGQFILGQQDAFYCTELIWYVVKEITFVDIVPNKRIQWQNPYIGLDDLTLNPYLKEILALESDLAKP